MAAPTKIRFAGWSSPFAMGGHNRGDWESGENLRRGRGWEKRERSPEFLSRILVPSLRAEMRWKTAPSWDRLTFSLLSTRILTSDFEHCCGSPIFQTCSNHGAGSRGSQARGNCTKLQMKGNVHGAEIPPTRKRKNMIEDGMLERRGHVFRRKYYSSFSERRAYKTRKISNWII